MKRRAFLRSTALVAAGALAAPVRSARAATRALRFVPTSDLANFDPIWSPAYVARNAGLLVWDMLYGVDRALRPQRQMVESEELSADGLTWTFRLRPGLAFHDGAPVLARDAVASINRWAAREPMGGTIKAIENELVALDDRTFRWSLRKPFPKLLLALGKITTPCCFIMPARIAATDPFKPIGEYVGSGPMRFARDEWVPGGRAVFERVPSYVPRPEPASWLAGGKRILVDRIEWLVMPDPSTAAAALLSGEVDWLERAIPDVLPMLQENRDLTVDIADPLGGVGVLLLNHLFPPFDDVRARRAMLMAISQADYMHVFVGDDDRLWKQMPGYFTPGTPLYTDAGGDILEGPRKLDAAKRLLAESGYAGAPVTVMAAQDLPAHRAWGDVTVALLKRLDVEVEYVAVDWGTLIARRMRKSPPDQGGWNLCITSLAGVDCADPTNKLIRARGDLPVNGWANSPPVEAEVGAWFDAASLDEERAAVRRLNKVALDYVVYAPLGCFLGHVAWRKTVTGIEQAPVPLFWNVRNAA
ncbi:MAG TPA: ABC transporter substrate-binding protein [Candidatus Sulfotelmatobacter sp.]|nr:ABC transporter substrate-binding protein [Candidatus Sulfotelmatobacter sp.]